MTIVAFDGKTIAADRRATNHGVPISVRKIEIVESREFGKCVAAVVGDLARGIAMREWLISGADRSSFPAATEKSDWACLLLFREDKHGPLVRQYENTPDWFESRTLPRAGGSGRDFALMAMRLGRSAHDAVALTIELSVQCGDGIDAISMEDLR